jgi:hypothetical protein
VRKFIFMARAHRKTNGQVPRRRMLKEAPKKPAPEIGLGRESASVVFFVLALFLALSLYSYMTTSPEQAQTLEQAPLRVENIMGVAGWKVAQGLIVLLGWCAFVTVLWALLLARTIWMDGWPVSSRSVLSLCVSTLSLLTMTASCAVVASISLGYKGGGMVGASVSSVLVNYVNKPGTLLIGGAVFLISVGVATGSGTAQVVALINDLCGYVVRFALHCWLLFLQALYNVGRWLMRLFGRGCRAILRGVGAAGLFCLGVFGLDKFVKRKDSAKNGERTAPWIQAEVKKNGKGATSSGFVLGTDFPAPEAVLVPTGAPLILRRDQFGANKGLSLVKPLRKKGAAGAKGSGTKAGRGKETTQAKEFVLPGPELLVSGESGAVSSPKDTDLIKNSKRLEQSLRNFRIGGRVTEVHPGPVITLYQFEPAAGIKVHRIVNLADDLALALKVASVRVFAPVPGKGTVGIEVPNAHREMVRLREVLESEEFQTYQAPLSLALGKDTYGEPFIVSLSKMPHLLIAGATGTGKSVCINSLLISLLFRNTPDELRLILIDPKMLELSVYEGIPHLSAPVITEPKRARGVLWWAIEEMEKRYLLMKALGVRDISMYNRIVGEKAGKAKSALRGKIKRDKTIELEEKDVVATGSPYEGLERGSEFLMRAVEMSQTGELQPLPRIVIVVDELADLMLTVGREVEELLTRIAQKARAAGLHLILATQRPSVNVITGLIKANFPARISFKVASKIDARTVMDTSGAEKLLGQGDLLFSSPALGGVKRLHSPFVSDKEVHDVVDWLNSQGAPDYDPGIEKMITKIEESDVGSGTGAPGDDEYDVLYDQAVHLVVEKGFASTSMVQRVFRIGYNRAARILEVMERDGVVGPADGAKPRQVLVGNSEDYR